MTGSPKNSIGAAGADSADGMADRDFIGTTSTSASLKSLWITFTAPSENSGCTLGIGAAGADLAGFAARNGFSFSVQFAPRAGMAAAAGTGAVAFACFTSTAAATTGAGVSVSGLGRLRGAKGFCPD